ncbi:valine--tRNA ligase [Patescibacteria group bacterium]|nr:valine--tRNA ligase [Patescibacteria group bacterium]
MISDKIAVMDKQYQPKLFEEKIYRMWERSGAFAPAKKGKPYCIIMPPPNANASLHAGHGMYAVDDVLIRWKRMQGFAAEWLPGTDHAGFETQYVFEKELAKKGQSRMDFDRKTLYENIFKFVKQNSGLIYQQFRRLGFSADWEKSVFSLDKKVVDFVIKTFEKMVNAGLVYRGDYMVNYCTHCGTSLAELEVKHLERVDPLYYIKYGPFTLATVRPETKFGDTAVAVNPKDKRYKDWVGKEVEVEGLLGKFKLKVISDDYVDMNFGTGVVKITPGHDPNDWEIGKRHNLEIKKVIDISGRLTELAGKYSGLKVNKAREVVVEDLKKAGLLVKVDEKYLHAVTVCYKCGRDLEPTIIPNWFVKVEQLKPAVVKAVKTNQTKFYPVRFKKQILNWMKMMHDWPISRQIAWGIRIPAWYSVKENPGLEVVFLNKNKKSVSGKIKNLLKKYSLPEIESGLQKLITPNEARFKIGQEKPEESYLQETDVFDTWFSSGQWPLVVKTELPTELMGTLADILRFWVSRMMMFSLYLTNEVPFKNVYLWSMVADKKGVKMSKSKGNVINPIELVDKYGADAFRMALIFGTSPGSKVILSDDKVRAMRNLTNKIWNATRFVIKFLKETSGAGEKDQEFKDSLNKCVKKTTEHLEKFRLGQASEQIYEWFWHWFCDQKIEEAKKGKISQAVLLEGLRTFLKLLHPFVPFVTEAVWQQLPKTKEKLLINSQWPS